MLYFGKNIINDEWQAVSKEFRDNLVSFIEIEKGEWESWTELARSKHGLVTGGADGKPRVIGYGSREYYALKEIENLKDKLSATDYIALKIAEGSATKEDYANIISQRKLWRERIKELETL